VDTTLLVGGALRAPHVHPVCCARVPSHQGALMHQDGKTLCLREILYNPWVVCLVVWVRVELEPPAGNDPDIHARLGHALGLFAAPWST
jgi:hypothetical protein